MAADERDAAHAETYLNPVHARDFPDPFVLKFAGEYFAYCTGFWRDGRCFGVMRSRDLVRWEELAGALEPLPGEHPCYWAPEVSYRDGKFLMYYSVGNEKLMHVRVAVATDPAGPFIDSGHRLTHEEFAIDPHVFADRDGARYLFYATDFLDHTHVGTGTVVDRLTDDFTLEGRARPVTRARYDWQVYDPARKEKGGVRWHTVEGPFVLERKGLYYEMFSGGNWQNVSYGVSYATSGRILRDDEWEQHADGEKILPVLRTVPGKIIGPGHNSVVRAPDNQQLFCVYHRWAEEGRVLAIDRMEFVGDGLTVLGATDTPQPAPGAPWLSDYFDTPRDDGLGDRWECLPRATAHGPGGWSVVGGEARRADAGGRAEARCVEAVGSFVAEVHLRALREGRGAGEGFGVALLDGLTPVLDVRLSPSRRLLVVKRLKVTNEWDTLQRLELPRDFKTQVFHQLRFEFDGAFARLTFDDGALEWRGDMGAANTASEPRYRLALRAVDCPAAFKGFTLTRGFADDFDQPAATRARGWVFESRADQSRVELGGVFEDRVFKLLPLVSARRMTDVPATGAHEMIVSLKVEGEARRAGRAELWAITSGAALPTGEALTLRLLAEGERDFTLSCGGADNLDGQPLRLPRGFDPFTFQHFRFRHESGRLRVACGAEFVCEVDAPATNARIEIVAGAGVVVSVDQVRVTAIEKR